jgi:putative two-component system response regulator
MSITNLSQKRVKIIDDSPTNIFLLVEALSDDYDVSVALDGETGLEDIEEEAPDLILLDIMMPGIDGYEVCRRLQSNPATRNIPIIFLTAMDEIGSKTQGFRLGAVDYITKPFEMLEVQARVKTHLALKCALEELAGQNELLEKKVQERTRELVLTQEVTILSMASLVEARDKETGGHIMRTQRYVKCLAEQLQDHPRFNALLTPENIELIYKSAPLHDIGKVGVPDRILQKPGKLTPEEFEEMKRHTLYGYTAIVNAEKKLGSSSFLRFAREITSTHHEHWDGTGYPHGLQESAIPIAGRLMALADIYDAMTSRRVYKEALSHTEVLAIIRDSRGILLDPDIVDAFFQVQGQFERIAELFEGNVLQESI